MDARKNDEWKEMGMMDRRGRDEGQKEKIMDGLELGQK